MSMRAQPTEDVTFVDFWLENTEIIQVAHSKQLHLLAANAPTGQRTH